MADRPPKTKPVRNTPPAKPGKVPLPAQPVRQVPQRPDFNRDPHPTTPGR